MALKLHRSTAHDGIKQPWIYDIAVPQTPGDEKRIITPRISALDSKTIMPDEPEVDPARRWTICYIIPRYS
jgi:hypothetical protein